MNSNALPTSVPTPEQIEMALAIVKAHYPEMSASYRGRRYLIALAAIIETQEACAKLAEYRGPWGDAATFSGEYVAELIRTGNHYGKDA